MSSNASYRGSCRGLHRRGFSFLEVMVVVVIIGLLAGAVAIKVGDYIDRAKINRAKSDISTIINALETYYMDQGVYPSNEQGLRVLPIKNIKDPWSHPYQYSNPGRSQDVPYEVISYGADKREGGEDMAADISSASLLEEEDSF